MFVGVPPYTPDTLIEVTIEGDRVWLRFADVFARPLHLTPEQGLALVAAGAASQACPAATARARWPRRSPSWPAVLGVEPAEARVGGPRRRPARACSRRCGSAVAEHRQVRLDYYAYGRDERTHPRRRPRGRRSPTRAPGTCRAGATWPTTSGCSAVDRIVEAEVLDETFDAPGRPRPAARSRRAPTCPG